MTKYWNLIKGLTITQAALVAGVALVLALFVIRGGLVNSFLWLVGLAALAIGAINKASYG